MRRHQRTGNPGGLGVPKTAADIAARLEDLTELAVWHRDACTIAARLGISTRTVYRYRARLREKT